MSEKKSYCVIGLYSDNYQRFAEDFEAETPEEAIKEARENVRHMLEGRACLLVAGVVDSGVKLLEIDEFCNGPSDQDEENGKETNDERFDCCRSDFLELAKQVVLEEDGAPGRIPEDIVSGARRVIIKATGGSEY